MYSGTDLLCFVMLCLSVTRPKRESSYVSSYMNTAKDEQLLHTSAPVH